MNIHVVCIFKQDTIKKTTAKLPNEIKSKSKVHVK